MDTDKKPIPHEHVVFALSKGKSPTDVTLRSAEWAVITQIDGHKTIADVAKVLALNLDEALNLFNGLYEKELIEIVSTTRLKEDIAPTQFFSNLETELTAVIGPVAPFVIEDALWAIEGSKEAFLLERLPELIETISEEIPDDEKKVMFQQRMLKVMKEVKSE